MVLDGLDSAHMTEWKYSPLLVYFMYIVRLNAQLMNSYLFVTVSEFFKRRFYPRSISNVK